MLAPSAIKMRSRLAALALAAALAVSLGPPPAALADQRGADELADARELLVAQVEEHARLAAPMTGRELIDPAILDAMRQLPRHAFVEAEAAAFAYLDIPLPADHGLRESQPYIVALMTDAAALEPTDDVLILGVGGGYHAALARRVDGRVYSVDLDQEAVETVRARLAELDYGDIELRAGDPYDGWPEIERQFDAIIVRLAIDRVPPLLLRQLAPGGKLVAPIGRADDGQILTLVTRGQNDSFAATPILPVRFMRLPGGERL
jgi:protein-L-isoaspartate(D-aspartate) O-methyltransferase